MLDWVPDPAPTDTPQHPVLYVFKAVREACSQMAWTAFIVGAVVFSEYFSRCQCGHGPMQHDRDWPKGCRKCECRSLSR